MNLEESIDLRLKLWTSPLYFTQYFYKLRMGKDFIISSPLARQAHQLDIFEALTRCFTGKTKRLIINIPPRYGKTISVIHFIAWAMSQYPDSNFIYTSYSYSLAKKQTQTIRDIISMPFYKRLFGVELNDASAAKDDFETTAGGSVYAAGTGGSITGRGAGIFKAGRFGGCIVIDDSIKPDEATSDTIREGINEWYYNTLQSRLNSPDTPIIYIGQRVHEDDLAAHLIDTGEWETLILPALDAAGNALDPEKHDKKALLKMKEDNPYVFAAQYQQDPQPAGGGVFKPEWWYLTDEEPKVLATFITCDTAESTSDYADYTAFSFWGMYKIQQSGMDSNIYGLQWIDCYQERIEPKDLKAEFMEFYSRCMTYPVKPSLAAIEKKSTGTTLLSMLEDVRGLQIRSIERTKASGSKAARFLEMQPFIAGKLISLPRNGRHTQMCLEHMRKITLNDSHRHDDVADNCYDAIKLALIDKSLDFYIKKDDTQDKAVVNILSTHRRILDLKGKAYR